MSFSTDPLEGSAIARRYELYHQKTEQLLEQLSVFLMRELHGINNLLSALKERIDMLPTRQDLDNALAGLAPAIATIATGVQTLVNKALDPNADDDFTNEVAIVNAGLAQLSSIGQSLAPASASADPSSAPITAVNATPTTTSSLTATVPQAPADTDAPQVSASSSTVSSAAATGSTGI